MATLHCSHCSTPYDRPNAGLDGPGKVRLGRPPRYCSDACRQSGYRAREAERAAGAVAYPDSLPCNACAETKPIGEFYRVGGPEGAPRQPCRECRKSARRARYRERQSVA